MTSDSPEVILTQLERITTSRTFRHSERMVRFLEFVVKHSVEERSEPLKEYLIGVEVFDKSAGFDPKADPQVRVEARRLRAKLREFYEGEGQNDRLLISLADRGYTPSFEYRDASSPMAVVSGRWRKLALAGFAAILLVAGAVWWMTAYSRTRSSGRSKTTIAVLPFADISPNTENEYFSDGLTDEVINSLTAIDGLNVIARTSVFQFKRRGADIRSIARDLNAQMVLEGSVRKEGDTVRVTAQLIDASNGSHLWSQTLERKLTSVLEIQEDIARAVAGRLRLDIGRSTSRGTTRNPEAYNLYLRGRYAWFHFAGPAARKSIGLFEQAIALDPGFAAAHAELAMAYALATDTVPLPAAELMPRAQLSARRALEIDPDYAEAHVAMGAVKTFLEWDWKGAEGEFRRALELNPNSHRARFDYAILCLRPLGRFDEAALQLRRVLELDPVSPFVNAFLGRALIEGGRYREAIAHLKQATDLDPNYALTHTMLGEAYIGNAMCKEALDAFSRSRLLGFEAPHVFGYLAYLHAQCGVRAQALELLNQLENLRPPPEVDIARIYAGLGDKERAFACLDRAAAHRYTQLVFLRGSLALGDLRSDPRFDRLLFEKMGLPR